MHNPMVKLALVLAVLLGGLGYGVSSYRGLKVETEHKLGLERIRREYLERAPMARMMPDPVKYGDEQRAVWKWYAEELTGHYNRYAKFKNYERFLDDLSARKARKKIKADEYAQYEERYKQTKALFDLMQSGKYTPVFTALEKSLRFDLYDVRPTPGGLRLSFMLAGAQRKWSHDTSGRAKVSKLVVNAAFNEMVFKGFDAEGKPITEMRVSGDPFKIDNPERFVEEFPPGIVLGYYDIPLIPYEVATAELTFQVSTRSLFTGEEVAGNFVWKMPLEREWKLSPGSAWEGAQEQVREAPEAEEASAKGKKGRR